MGLMDEADGWASKVVMGLGFGGDGTCGGCIETCRKG